MALATANGIACTSAAVTLSVQGRSTATITLEEPAAWLEGDPVTLVFGGETFEFAVRRTSQNQIDSSADLVAGVNKLDTELEPRFYEGIAVQTIITDIIRGCGEVAGTIEAPDYVRQWHHGRERAGVLLRHICEEFGMGFRSERDGKIRVGKLEYSSYPDVLETQFAKGSSQIWRVPLTLDLDAGMTVTLNAAGDEFAVRAERVIHRIDAYGAFTGIWGVPA